MAFNFNKLFFCYLYNKHRRDTHPTHPTLYENTPLLFNGNPRPGYVTKMEKKVFLYLFAV